jgi:hypothetical protein
VSNQYSYHWIEVHPRLSTFLRKNQNYQAGLP